MINNWLQTTNQYPSCTSFAEIFEKIIFNKIYQFLSEKRLLNPNQSEPCINQVIAVTH